MESNLPLVFSNGRPTSLENMSLSELKRFLLFIRKCELNRKEMPNSLGETKPRWWPNDIMFDDDILLRTSNRGTWSRNLRKIITAVYNHYESQFLLDFSKRLMVCFSQDMVDIKENENGTRSMVSQNKKLLVTFKSENMDYDKEGFCRHSIMLNKQRNATKRNQSSPYLPKLTEVYLCEHCGADYNSLDEVMEHEKRCSQKLLLNDHFDSPRSTSSFISSSSFNSNGDESSSGYSTSAAISDSNLTLSTIANRYEPDISKFQCQFLENFGLFPIGKVHEKKEVVHPKASSYARFVSIELCSPLGQSIIRGGQISLNERDYNIQTGEVEENRDYLERKERKGLRSEKTSSKTNIVDNYPTEFPITYKKDKNCKQDPHVYSFNKRQRQMRVQVLERGLSHRALNLLKLTNKRKVRIPLLCLKVKTGQLPAIDSLTYPENQNNKVYSNKRPKMEPTSTKPMAQKICEENVPTLINSNLSCQKIKLPKVILPQIKPVIVQEDCKNKHNDVEIIDLCSSEGED